MSEQTEIGWTDHTFSPWWGCAHVSPGCVNCLAPETRVLHADMLWRPIGSTQVGDRLVALDDELPVGANRKMRIAEVQAVWRREAATVELHVGSRRVVCSADHRWLARIRPSWRTAESLHLGVELRTILPPIDGTFTRAYRAGYIAGATVGDGTFRYTPGQRSNKLGDPQAWWRVAEPEFDRPLLERLREFLFTFGVEVEIRSFDSGSGPWNTQMGPLVGRVPMLKVEARALGNLSILHEILRRSEDTPEWKAGWVAGLYDTDGSFNESVRVSQKKSNGALEQWAEYVHDLGFAAKVERWESSACPTVRLEGGLVDKLGFFAAIRPALTRKTADIYGRLAELDSTRVTGLLAGPVRELVDIQTSTGTFIAEGIVTHNCYAEAWARRTGHDVWGKGGARRFFGEKHWAEPLRWNAAAERDGVRRRVFCASMADVFEPRADLDSERAKLWPLIEATPLLDWLLLTKRPEEMTRMAPWSEWPANVWAGTSVENQEWADKRIPELRKVPARIRFLSCEPLLGPVDLSAFLVSADIPNSLRGSSELWVIIGGESGRGHRPMELDWLALIVEQCQVAAVPCFVKQDSGPRPGQQGRIPDDLWALKEFPVPSCPPHGELISAPMTLFGRGTGL